MYKIVRCILLIVFLLVLAGSAYADNPVLTWSTCGFTAEELTSVVSSKPGCISVEAYTSVVSVGGCINYKLKCDESHVPGCQATITISAGGKSKKVLFTCRQCIPTKSLQQEGSLQQVGIAVTECTDSSAACSMDTIQTYSTEGCEYAIVPTLNSWGYLVLLLLLAGVAVWIIHKRRTRVA
ncbi:hypothetical protein KAR91_10420 [Candidatus Pacearchaeota archaeon]|nr:hypothetical protein [Candidatus Pacearchaeota archaeon]